MATSDSQRRCVFVGNIPYDATEEQLIQICEEVGPVVSFRLVIDRETGKPNGYGFCEYKDEETSLSARRNLQGYKINGRQLRVDFAENDKNSDRNREQGCGGPGMVANADSKKNIGGPAVPVDSALQQPLGMPVAMTAAAVMAGALGASQSGSSFSQPGVDPLTLHMSKLSRSQLNDVMSEFKAMCTQNKEQTRQLLLAIPNLSKALFQLVLDVKERLEREYTDLPVGRNGRDDEEMILWFLKDRKFSVDDAVSKLHKAIRWRHEFGVSDLSEESVKNSAETGKAYVHDNFDVNGRPVLIVDSSKHFPQKQDPVEDEKLCVFLIEKALSRLPAGKQDILGIFDLRGFGTENADLKFLTFLFDVFYYYYPRRLGQVLFVDAPFVFKPLWQLVKPMLKQYASLVRFCSAKEVREEYFTEDTLPASFRK